MKLRHFIHPLIMGVVLIGAIALYSAWYVRVGTESATAVSLAGKVRDAQTAGTRAQAAKDELQKAADDGVVVQSYFVRTADVVPYLESLQSTGAALGTDVEVASVSSDSAKPHAHLTLALTIAGTFDSVMRTLGIIEYEPYDTTVQNLSLTTSDEGAGVGQWTANVTLLIGTSDATSTPAIHVAPISVPQITSTPVVSSTSTSSSTTASSTSSSTQP